MKRDSRMNIGIIQQSPDIGGAETSMISLMKEFKKKNAVLFFATDSAPFLQLASQIPDKTYNIPFRLDVIGNIRGLINSLIRLPFALIYYSYLLSVFKKNSVHVILMSGFSEKMVVSVLSMLFSIPVVWIEHGPLQVIYKRNAGLPYWLYRICSSIPTTIITPSDCTRESLINEGKVDPKKVRTIYNGVDTDVLMGDGDEMTTKKSIKKNESIITIGNVSRLTREKGQDILLDAAVIVLQRIPHVQFVFVGQGPDYDFFIELSKKNKIENNVSFVGYVDNLYSYYKQMDIFVFPTVWDLEGFGLVAAEAMYCGVPVIASDIGPVSEVVEDNKTGLLFPPGDVNALAEKIIMLVQDEKKRVRYGINGKEKARRDFSIEKSGEKIYRVLIEAYEKQKSIG